MAFFLNKAFHLPHKSPTTGAETCTSPIRITFLAFAISALGIKSDVYAHDIKGRNLQVSPERKNYPLLEQPVGPYVHAVKHNNILYLSGVSAFGTKVQSQTIEEQAKEIFRQIQLIAKAENSSLANIIKVTVYVTDLSRMHELRNMLYEIYGKHLPASSLIQVNGLFSSDLKIEVEAIIAL